MENSNLVKDVSEIAQLALEPGFQIYELSLVHVKNNLRIRVFLDNVNDPWGTPSIADCGRFSRSCDAKLMDMVKSGKLAEDYTLEVSSPGAERELRNSEEWFRFQDKPMKVRYSVGGKKIQTIVVNFIGLNSGQTIWKKAELKRSKKLKQKKEFNEIIIDIKDINQVRLYLDF